MERYKKIIPQWESFIQAIKKGTTQTIRVNTLKITPSELKERLEKKGWRIEETEFDFAFRVKEERSIANTLEFYLGFFYIQQLTSLLVVNVLEPKPEEKILDLCAAPGGKTTFIAQLMKNRGLIVANEINYKRQRALLANIYRLGVTNTIVTGFNGLFFPADIKFDKVLVDVPCSAQANRVYKNQKIVDLKFIKRITPFQKGLLKKAIELVKLRGIVVYSTCTFSPEENEEVIDSVLKEGKVIIEKIKLDFPCEKGIICWEGKKFDESLKLCLRVYPYHFYSGGGFIARLRKIKD